MEKSQTLEVTSMQQKNLSKTSGPRINISDLSKAQFVSGISSYIEGLVFFGINLTKDNFPIITESHFVHWNWSRKVWPWYQVP